MNSIGRKTSMKDIADFLGVSKNTVSLALRGKNGVSEQLRDRVREAAIELNYAGYGQLQSAEDPARTVVVVVPEYVHSDKTFYYRIVMGLERHGTRSGVSVLIRTLSDEDEQELRLPALIDANDLYGFITIGNLSADYIVMLQDAGYLVVAVDNDYVGVEVDSVCTDNDGGAVQAINHLIELGHQRIGFCGPVRWATSFFHRWQGYQRALWTAGILEEPGLCCVDYGDGTPSVESVEPIVEWLSGLDKPPTAIFCCNDSVALSAYRAIDRLGMSIPEDISIVGFDNTELSGHAFPPLTTVNIRRVAMGEFALDLLLRDRIEGHTQKCQVALHTALVVRASTRSLTG